MRKNCLLRKLPEPLLSLLRLPPRFCLRSIFPFFPIIDGITLHLSLVTLPSFIMFLLNVPFDVIIYFLQRYLSSRSLIFRSIIKRFLSFAMIDSISKALRSSWVTDISLPIAMIVPTILQRLVDIQFQYDTSNAKDLKQCNSNISTGSRASRMISPVESLQKSQWPLLDLFLDGESKFESAKMRGRI